MRAKKFAAYVAVLIVLAAVSFVVGEVRTTWDVVRNPDVRTGGSEPIPRSATSSDFVVPQAGAERNMSASELAWLLRERIVLDVWEDFTERDQGRELYNERVRAYNEHAAVISYHDSDMRVAEARVERMKRDIVEDAVAEATQALMPQEIQNDTRAREVWRAQKYLYMAGSYHKRPSGREDEETAYAVKLYQTRAGVDATGRIDEALLSHLEEAYLAKRTPASVGF